MTNFIYSLTFFSSAYNPLDATAYYIGQIVGAPTATSGVYQMRVPYTGSIRRVNLLIVTAGTLGSGETGSLDIWYNNTTSFPVSSQLSWDQLVFSRAGEIGSGVIPVTVDDFIEIKITTPTWATNPTSVVYTGHIWIEGN